MDQTSCKKQVWHGQVEVAENVRLARDTFRLRFSCPEIARIMAPGQFVMIRLSDCNDPLLGRPMAIYDSLPGPGGEPDGLDIVYLVVGKMTGRLALVKPGGKLDIWGPLGNGFPAEDAKHLLMVAGGIGQTPFLALAREYLGLRQFGVPPRVIAKAKKVTLCHGARSADYLASVEDYRNLGVDVRISTDDGSLGYRGLVTDLIEPAVNGTDPVCRDGSCAVAGAGPKSPDNPPPAPSGCLMVCCGPEPMLESAAKIARRLGVPCRLSLETPMACGMGICFSCVAKISDGAGGWDYRRTCVEGPVFDAAVVRFD